MVQPEAEPAPAPFEPRDYVMRGPRRDGSGNAWNAVMVDERILLASPTSAGWHVDPRPQAAIEQGRHVFRTARMTVAIAPGACDLAQYRARLPDRVSLEWDGSRFEGCGGPRPRPAGVADTVWELARLGTEPPPADRSPAATLGFAADGRVGGTHVCNNVGSNLRWRPDGGFDRRRDEPAFMSTAVGCYGPSYPIAQGFWQLMARVTRWRRDGDRLFVTGANGDTAELRFLIAL
jgi:heat shock protein HslJ